MLSSLIRGSTSLAKTVTSSGSRKTMTSAEKAIAKKLRKKGYKIPKTSKPSLNVTYGRKEIR